MKVVFSTTDPSEAAIFSALLGQEGIASKIQGEGSAYYAVGMPTSAAPLNIAVQEADAEAADGIIQGVLQKRSEKDRDPKRAGAFERSVESNHRRWRWILVGGYGLPFVVILGIATVVGGRQIIESPAWMTGTGIIALLVGSVLWANRKKGSGR